MIWQEAWLGQSGGVNTPSRHYLFHTKVVGVPTACNPQAWGANCFSKLDLYLNACAEYYSLSFPLPFEKKTRKHSEARAYAGQYLNYHMSHV